LSLGLIDGTFGAALLGLGSGILFLAILGFTLTSNQIQEPIGQTVPVFTTEHPPPTRQFGDAAIRIALANVTQEEGFEGKELIVFFYRDHGVGFNMDNNTNVTGTCPMNHCALVVFADREQPKISLVSVIVNMDSKQIVHMVKASDIHESR
jgi:hypothetical protein